MFCALQSISNVSIENDVWHKITFIKDCFTQICWKQRNQDLNQIIPIGIVVKDSLNFCTFATYIIIEFIEKYCQ